MATTEITDAAIRATATAMAFRPIEGARPPEGPGWGRAFYEPSPFDVAPGPARRPVVHVGQQEATATGTGMGRRRAETMPGGMVPVVDPQPRATPFDAGARVDLATIAGPSRVVRNEVEEDGEVVFGFATGDEIAMDLD